MPRPHAKSSTAFTSGEMRKSFMGHGLNKMTRLYGGRVQLSDPGPTKYGNTRKQGKAITSGVLPSKVVKTIVNCEIEGVRRNLGFEGYLTVDNAKEMFPYVKHLVYRHSDESEVRVNVL